jgi:thiosulfate/3-mercaptopyruvate sulfurtransferase
MIPKKEMVEALFSQLGISNQDTIIVYDNKGSTDAARLWWILKTYGFEPVRILNGGLRAWEASDGPISTKTIASGTTTDFKLPSDINRDILAMKEDVISAISKKEHKTHLVDVRTAEEYSGKIIKEGAIKAGRIPNSLHIDWAETIDYEGTKKFRTYSELKKIYEKAGLSKSDSIIVYCHTGGRAAHTTFVLTELLGYENVKNYDGSWTEWSRFEDLPFENDSITYK